MLFTFNESCIKVSKNKNKCIRIFRKDHIISNNVTMYGESYYVYFYPTKHSPLNNKKCLKTNHRRHIIMNNISQKGN